MIAGISLIVSPGPATLSMAAVGSAHGFRSGIPYLLGCASGLMAVMLIAALGLSGLVKLAPWLTQLAAAVGITYILYLAYKIASRPVGIRCDLQSKAPRFAAGVMVSLSNPKAWAVMGALFAGMGIPGKNEPMDITMKMLALGIITVSGNFGWTFLGDRISRVMQDSNKGRVLNNVFAVALVVSVVLALLL